MSTINRIEQALKELEGGAFQKLADAYLYKKGYTHINPLGSVIGSNKVRKGTPDTLITLPNGKYVFAEHTTTEQNKPVEKLKSDLAKCLDDTKTGVPVSKIEEIVFCFNFLLGTEDTHEITEACQKRGVNINLFGLGPITYDLAYSYPGLAKDFLSIDVDTGQILRIEDFVFRYDKNKLTTRLQTAFLFREEEVSELTQALNNFDVVLISGRSGTGKSRLALECCEKFKALHSEFKVFGIYNAGVDIFDDLRTYFSEAGHFLIFVDDANRINRFETIVRLIENAKNQKIKIIATVRDYALEKIREVVSRASYKELQIGALPEEQIKAIVENEYDIHNYLYLDRIADIAKGNPRIAMMAAEIASRENTLSSIRDVSDLYDRYFASIRKDLEEFGDKGTLKAAGIIAFFRAIDRSNTELMSLIEESFGISSEQFWNAAKHLHELEMFDIYEDEIVKTSDQVLSTYLFYLAFIKEQVLDFSILLRYFSSKFRHRIIDVMGPIFSIFGTDSVKEFVRKHLDLVWAEKIEQEDQEGLLHIIDIFGHVDETNTLITIQQWIEAMDTEAVEIDSLTFSASSDFPSPSIPSVLSLFKYSDSPIRRMALELLFAYLEKRPQEVSHVIRLLVEGFGFEYESSLQGFVVQHDVVDTLISQAKEKKSEIILECFVAVAEKYLQTHIHLTRSKSAAVLQIHDFDLQMTKELLDLRRIIWANLCLLYKNPFLQETILTAVSKCITQHVHRSSVKKILTNDATLLLSFFEAQLNPEIYSHCQLVNKFLDRLDLRKIPYNASLRNRFQNDIYTLSELFVPNMTKMQTLKLKYGQYHIYRIEKIREHFAQATEREYQKLFQNGSEAISKPTPDEPAISRYETQQGILYVLRDLAARDKEMYVQVLKEYLRSGEILRFDYHFRRALILALTENQGYEVSFRILSEVVFVTQRAWLIDFYVVLPPEDVTAQYIEDFYSLYKEADIDELPSEFGSLLKFRRADSDIIIKLITLLLDKAKTDQRVFPILTSLFDYGPSTDQWLTDVFGNDLPLLKDTYLATFRFNPQMDYQSKILAYLVEKDPGFIFTYFLQEIRRQDSTGWDNGYHDYSFLWLRNDYETLMPKLIEFLHANKYDSLKTIFTLQADGTRNEEIKKRQDLVLRDLITHHYSNIDLMESVFELTTHFSLDRRRNLLDCFLKLNARFEDFERLDLEPNNFSAQRGSFVPVYQARMNYLKSLVPLLNTVKLLRHRQMVEQKIEGYQSRIASEKKRDFMGDY